MARRYVEESKVIGPERDKTMAKVAIALVHDGRAEEGAELLKRLQDDAAKLPARYAIAKVEATETAAKPSAVYQRIESLTNDAERASALAGVGVAMFTK